MRHTASNLRIVFYHCILLNHFAGSYEDRAYSLSGFGPTRAYLFTFYAFLRHFNNFNNWETCLLLTCILFSSTKLVHSSAYHKIHQPNTASTAYYTAQTHESEQLKGKNDGVNGFFGAGSIAK